MGHFYPRQTILAPSGLTTEPNEYGHYPAGALRVARNVVMRQPGKIEQAPNVRNQVAVGAADDVIHKLMPADTGVVYAVVADDPVVPDFAIYADGVAQSYAGDSGARQFSATGRISWAQCNERVLVNGNSGTLVRDPGVTVYGKNFRAAGLPQFNVVSAAVTAGSPTWLDTNQMVGYRVCLARRYTNPDYTLRSAPSVPVKVFNAGAKGTVDVRIEWPIFFDFGIQPGDIIELYRTDILTSTVVTADPGGVFKLVKEFQFTTMVEVNAGSIVLRDTQEPVQGTLVTPGRELYTNPGIEGENYANLRPPTAKCLVSFKGFCFYGYTTERAELKLSFPGGLGSLNAASRATGIGRRAGAGTITAGSANITGVSAADLVGIKVNQLWGGSTANWPLTATVSAVGVSSITMSSPALAAGTAFALDDMLSINGTVCRMGADGLLGLLDDLNGRMEAQVNQTLPATSGLYQTGAEITLMENHHPFGGVIGVNGTNLQNYAPPLVAGANQEPLTRKNRLAWSKEQQPEHVPSVSETFVGFGEIYSLNATRDAVWIWCSDGLFRLGGNGGSLGLGAWQIDYANATLLLCAPQASTVLEDILYGYCNVGVVAVDSAGNVNNISAGTIGDIVPGPRYREVLSIIMERNETDDEVLLTLGEANEDHTASFRIYLYNVRQKAWTYLEKGEAGFGLDLITAIGMFRLPPGGAEPHVLFASQVLGAQPVYASWDAPDDFCDSTVQYQSLYGEQPLELKRWMWADYLFDANSQGSIDVLWNDLSFGGIPLSPIDIGVYARAGCPREVGVSHSLRPGFRWRASTTQRRFQGISLAVKQRTNTPKERGA